MNGTMELTPKQVVAELDRYIIGQDKAKRAVAVALRNRYRRKNLPEAIRDEITPKNIIMKGPTGVGKTEIARRLSKLVRAPFVKVEATKFTEVGYVGRDVESMIRDLVEVAIRIVREEKAAEVEPKAREIAANKLIGAMVNAKMRASKDKTEEELREELTKALAEGRLDDVPVEIEVEEAPQQLTIGPIGAPQDSNIGEILSRIIPRRKHKRRISFATALRIFVDEEASKMLDKDLIQREGLNRAEQEGIIFIDELDKIANKGGRTYGQDVSREGVQRDILPIVEGCTVSTKYGNIKTDYILFIASGAFHVSKISDLIPELQGRFPITVELDSLGEEDFVRILKETENALLMQYSELLKVEKVLIKFTDGAIREMAHVAFLENENRENIGARRLHTIMETLLEEISFEAADCAEEKTIVIDKKYVDEHLAEELKAMNLKKYIL